jgi:hypothetical protein
MAMRAVHYRYRRYRHHCRCRHCRRQRLHASFRLLIPLLFRLYRLFLQPSPRPRRHLPPLIIGQAPCFRPVATKETRGLKIESELTLSAAIVLLYPCPLLYCPPLLV